MLYFLFVKCNQRCKHLARSIGPRCRRSNWRYRVTCPLENWTAKPLLSRLMTLIKFFATPGTYKTSVASTQLVPSDVCTSHSTTPVPSIRRVSPFATVSLPPLFFVLRSLNSFTSPQTWSVQPESNHHPAPCFPGRLVAVKLTFFLGLSLSKGTDSGFPCLAQHLASVCPFFLQCSQVGCFGQCTFLCPNSPHPRQFPSKIFCACNAFRFDVSLSI